MLLKGLDQGPTDVKSTTGANCQLHLQIRGFMAFERGTDHDATGTSSIILAL